MDGAAKGNFYSSGAGSDRDVSPSLSIPNLAMGSGAWPLLQQFKSEGKLGGPQPLTKQLVSCGFLEPYDLIKVDDPNFSISKMGQPWRMIRSTPKYWRKQQEERQAAEIARLEALAKEGVELTLEQKLIVEHGSWKDALAAANAFAKAEASKDRGPRADQSKVAPVSGTAKKKKRTKQVTKNTYILGDETLNDKKTSGKDRSNWLLMDVDESPDKLWKGSVDQEMESTYVLFVENGNGFTVCPVDKRYRFLLQPSRSQASSDKAMELVRRKLAIFGKDPTDLLSTGRFKDNETLKEQQRRLKNDSDAGQSGSRLLANDDGEHFDDAEGGSSRPREGADMEDKGLDFNEEEMFADDEDEVIGIEDSEMIDHIQKKRKYESKLANQNFVEGVDVDEDDNLQFKDRDDEVNEIDIESKKEEQRERLLLAKNESNGAYIVNSDDENPYISQSEIDEDDESEGSLAASGSDIVSEKAKTSARNSEVEL